MTNITPEQVVSHLEWRYACKRFDATRTIPESVWSALERSLVLTPSSYGLQPWKFLILRDRGLRKSLVAHSWKQMQVEECSHFVVFLGLRKVSEADVDRLIRATAESRGLAAATLDGYRNMMVGDLVKGPRAAAIQNWAANQVYIALGNFMTCAAMLGVDACPMEGIDPLKYDEILGLRESPYQTLVACAAGYRAADDKYAKLKKVRFEAQTLIETR